jgi:predicted DNA-binding transcriptional regulator YafY
MTEVTPTNETFPVPDGFDPVELQRKLFGRYASMQGEMEEVRIRIDAVVAPQLQLKRWHADQQTVEMNDGGIEIVFPVASGGSKQPYGNVIGWVLGMGRHAQVLAPERLKQLVSDEVRAMHASMDS